MKKFNTSVIFLICIALTFMIACGSNKNTNNLDVYIYPTHEYCTDAGLELTSVTCSSNYTILEFTSYNIDRYDWCTIAPNNFIYANNKKYAMIKAAGIATYPGYTEYPDFSPVFGVSSVSFTLCFPALPKNVTKFDFFSSYDNEHVWEINGVELKHGSEVEIKGKQVKTSYHIWECESVEVQDGQTIVKKRVTPIIESSDIFSVGSEYIEDAVTGRKYYLKASSIGYLNSGTFVEGTTPLEFYEVYEALPSYTTNINIFSGHEYYVKDLVIRE